MKKVLLAVAMAFAYVENTGDRAKLKTDIEVAQGSDNLDGFTFPEDETNSVDVSTKGGVINVAPGTDRVLVYNLTTKEWSAPTIDEYNAIFQAEIPEGEDA